MNKQYDILIVHLMNKIKSFYFTGLADMLVPIGAANKVPNVDDIEYAAMVAAMFILHTCEVDIDSNFPDILETKADILKALDSFENLKERLKDFKKEHNERLEDQALKRAMMNIPKGQA